MSERSPRVSVVMPAYRHEAWVGEAVRSVLDQDLADLELIVVDDASPDRTAAHVAGIEDPRLRLIRHDTNLGAHAAINRGLAEARAPFLAIINSDDVWAPQRLSRLTAALEDEGFDLVGSDVTLLDAASQPIDDPQHWWNVGFARLKSQLRASHDIGVALLHDNLFMTTSNFLFRRRVLNRLEGFRNWRYLHDYDFLLRALGEGDLRLGFLADEPLMAYRLHGRNTIFEDAVAPREECFALLVELGPDACRHGAVARVQALVAHLSALHERALREQGLRGKLKGNRLLRTGVLPRLSRWRRRGV